jgi:hypothetical protein
MWAYHWLWYRYSLLVETDGEKAIGFPNHFLLKLQPRGKSYFDKDIWLPEMWREKFSPMFNSNKWISNLNEGTSCFLFSSPFYFTIQANCVLTLPSASLTSACTKSSEVTPSSTATVRFTYSLKNLKPGCTSFPLSISVCIPL